MDPDDGGESIAISTDDDTNLAVSNDDGGGGGGGGDGGDGGGGGGDGGGSETVVPSDADALNPNGNDQSNTSPVKTFPTMAVIVAVVAVLLLVVAVVIGLRCCNGGKNATPEYDRGIILANPTFQQDAAPQHTLPPNNRAPVAAPQDADLMGGEAMYEVIPDAQPLSFTQGQAKPMMETAYMDQPAAPSSDAAYAVIDGLGGGAAMGDTYDEIGIQAAMMSGGGGGGMPPPIGTIGRPLDVPSYAELSQYGGDATYDSVGIAAHVGRNDSGV